MESLQRNKNCKASLNSPAMKRIHLLVCTILTLIVLVQCKKESNSEPPPPPPPPPGGGNLSITGTSPEYVFWGDELTINGNGFSNTAAENIVFIKGNKICSADTNWQKATVVSATSSKLVVKVPFVTQPNGVHCGNDWGRVRVTVRGNSVLYNNACKFVGPPVMSLCNPYGITINSAPPGSYRPGDSSFMNVHLQTLYTKESGYYDRVKLYVNGSLLNTIDRILPGATCGGLAFVLPPDVYAITNDCDTPSTFHYAPARKMTFVAKVDGTNWADTSELWVLKHPKTILTNIEGPTTISKSAGGNPYVKVKGQYFYFTKIEWQSNYPAFHTSPPLHSLTSTQLDVYIPLSLMNINTTYTAIGKTACGTSVTLFSVTITP